MIGRCDGTVPMLGCFYGSPRQSVEFLFHICLVIWQVGAGPGGTRQVRDDSSWMGEITVLNEQRQHVGGTCAPYRV